jgi:hypothetical protein
MARCCTNAFLNSDMMSWGANQSTSSDVSLWTWWGAHHQRSGETLSLKCIFCDCISRASAAEIRPHELLGPWWILKKSLVTRWETLFSYLFGHDVLAVSKGFSLRIAWLCPEKQKRSKEEPWSELQVTIWHNSDARRFVGTGHWFIMTTEKESRFSRHWGVSPVNRIYLSFPSWKIQVYDAASGKCLSYPPWKDRSFPFLAWRNDCELKWSFRCWERRWVGEPTCYSEWVEKLMNLRHSCVAARFAFIVSSLWAKKNWHWQNAKLSSSTFCLSNAGLGTVCM